MPHRDGHQASKPRAPLDSAWEYLSSSDISGRLVVRATITSAAKKTTIPTSSSLSWLKSRPRPRGDAGAAAVPSGATAGAGSRLSAVSSTAAISAAMDAVSQVDGPPITQKTIQGTKPMNGLFSNR